MWRTEQTNVAVHENASSLRPPSDYSSVYHAYLFLCVYLFLFVPCKVFLLEDNTHVRDGCVPPGGIALDVTEREFFRAEASRPSLQL